MPRPRHIDGLQAARLANEAAQREPVRALASIPDESRQLVESRSKSDRADKKAPPRLKKPSRQNDEVLAPTAELKEHKAALRRVSASPACLLSRCPLLPGTHGTPASRRRFFLHSSLENPAILRAPLAGGEATPRSSTSPRVTGRTPRTAPDSCASCRRSIAPRRPTTPKISPSHVSIPPRVVPLSRLSRCPARLGHSGQKPHARSDDPLRPRGTLRRQAQDIGPRVCHGCQRRAVPDVQSLRQVSVEWITRRHGCLVSGRKIVGRRLMQKLAIAATAASFWGHMGHLPHAVGFFSTPRSKIPRFSAAPLAGGEATPRSSTSPRVTGRTPRTAPDSMCVVSTINCATSTDHAQNLAIPRLHTAPRCPAVPLVPLSREVGTLGTKASRPIGRPIARRAVRSGGRLRT